MKKPFVGQDVHFHPNHGRVVAAKVTRVWSPYCVNLVAFDDGTLGAPVVFYLSVSWATSYGYENGFSYVEDSPEYKAAATPKMDVAVPLLGTPNPKPSAFAPDPVTKTTIDLGAVVTTATAEAAAETVVKTTDTPE